MGVADFVLVLRFGLVLVCMRELVGLLDCAVDAGLFGWRGGVSGSCADHDVDLGAGDAAAIDFLDMEGCAEME